MKNILLLLIISLSLLGCEKEDQLDENFSYIYGDWIPIQFYSGFNFNRDPATIGDLIQIVKNDSYKILQNNSIVESGEFDIKTQTSNQLCLEFIPKGVDKNYTSRLSGSILCMHKASQDTIAFGSSAVDGGAFGFMLKRNQ